MTIKWQFYYSAHASCTQCALNSSDQQVLVYVCLKNYTKCNLSTSLVTVHCSVFDYSQTTVYCKYLPFIYQFISLNLVLYFSISNISSRHSSLCNKWHLCNILYILCICYMYFLALFDIYTYSGFL